MTVIAIVICVLGTIPKSLVKRLEDLEFCGDHPNYSIIEINQNTKQSLWDFRRLAIIQNQVKNHQLKLVWKILQGVKY